MASALKNKKLVLGQLAKHLERCPEPDEESKDLEHRFQALLTEYISQYAKFEDMCSGDSSVDVDAVLPGPHMDTTQVASSFQKWRNSFASKITDLDDRLPKLRLAAERMHNEVEQALTPGHDPEVIKEFLRQHCVRRSGTLRCQRAMMSDRLRSCRRISLRETPPAQRPSSMRQSDAIQRDLAEAAGKILDRELHMTEVRAKKLRPGNEPPANLHEVYWSGALLAVIRQHMSEDVSTKVFRNYLARLQYIGFTHRTRIWRRALELRSVTEIPCGGESPDSPLCRPCRVPTSVRSRSHLESVLEELGPVFGCSVSLRMDRGRSFAHQVAIDFASNFEKQQKRMSFRIYPIQAFGAESRDMPHDAAQRGSADEAPPYSAAEREAEAEACYVRPSEWALRVPWRAREDPGVLEQGLLLRASFASSHTPARLVHGPPSYARKLLENVVGNAEPMDGPSWKSDTDSVLQAEKAFLEVGDVKMVLRRLNDSGRRPAQPEDASDSLAFQEADDPTRFMQPMLRAYALLRHLQCRGQRRKLLDLLNFFRFVQRRLLSGLDEERAALSSQKTSKSHGQQRCGSGGHQSRPQWELSPRALTKLSKQCPMPSMISSEPGDASNMPLLDREHLEEVHPGEVVVVSETGLKVIHEIAMDDLMALEREMLSIGSYYIHKYEASAGGTNIEKMGADRVGVLLDLYTSEVWLNSEKCRLLEIYLEIYEHTTDLMEKRDLAQRMIDVMAVRPRLDLSDHYFTDTYAVSISLFEARSALLRRLLAHQVRSERSVAKKAPDLRHKVERQSGSAMKAAATYSSVDGDSSAEPPRLSRRSYRDSQTLSTPSFSSSEDEDDESLPPKSAIAHSLEGYTCSCSNGGPMVSLLPSAEPVALDEFCRSACLTWKSELLIEQVHRDLVEQFHPSSGQLTSLLERSCYMVATELWRTAEEEKSRWAQLAAPHHDAELSMLVLKEIAQKVSTAGVRKESEDDEEERQPTPLLAIGGLDVDVHLHHLFTDLRRKCSNNQQELFLHMLANLFDHVLLRRKLSRVVVEVGCLEKAIVTQHLAFSSRLESVRPPVLAGQDQEQTSVRNKLVNTWIDKSGPTLSAGMYEVELGYVDLNTAKSLAMSVAPTKLQELRHLLQHELAYRNLVLTCAQHNALLLDPTMRSKEMSDVNLVGPSRDLMSGPGQVTDPGAAVMRRLRQTASLSGTRGERRTAGKKEPSKGRGLESQIFQDLSRYTHLLQTPSTHLEPIRAAILPLFSERSDQIRGMSLGVSETDRQVRLLWFRLLTSCSFVMVRNACDLSVRVQAAEAAVAFRAVATLIPAKLSPFDRFNDRKRQLIERDGTVGSVFSVPCVLDVLQLRGVQPDPDVEATMSDILSVLVPLPKTESNKDVMTRRSSRKMSFWGSEGANLPRPRLESEHEDHSRDRVVPTLEVEYEGPAFTTLQMLHELTSLIILHYTLATTDGDPLTLLRMQRFVRCNFMELDGTQDVVGNTLSRTEPTFESIEELRSCLSQLARRLDALEDNAHDPEQVLQVIQTEVRSAFRELLLLFRLSGQLCLEEGAVDHFTVFHQWTCFLENTPGMADSGALGLSIRPQPHNRTGHHVPLASLAIFGHIAACEPDVQLSTTRKRMGAVTNSRAISSEPEVTTLHSDGKRFISELHPEMYPRHTVLNPFMRAILAVHIPTTANGDYCFNVESRSSGHGVQGSTSSLAPLPAVSRLPWFHPSAPLLPLISALCSLPAERRHKVSAIRLRLHDRRLAFHKLHCISRHTDRAVDADSELFGTLVLLEMLKEHVIAGQLGVEPPDSRESLRRFEAHREAHFGLAVLAGESQHVVEEAISQNPMTKLTLVAAGNEEIEEPTPEDVRKEMEAALLQIVALATALDQLLLASACERIGCELARLADCRHRLIAAESAKSVTPSARERLAARGGSLYASKVDAVLHSLNQLRAKGTYVFSPGNDERAYVFKEHDLNTCVEDLMRTMRVWGDETIRSRDHLTNQLTKFLDFRYQVLVHELYQKSGQRSEGEETVLQHDARVKSEVADQSCKLVFEVDRLHRVIRDLRTVSRELDYRLSSEIWNKVREAVASLTSKLNAEIGLFRESHEDHASGAAQQMRKIREHVAGQLAEISAENYAAQQRAMQPWDEKDDDRASSGIGGPSDTPHKDADADTKKALVVSDGMHKKFREVFRKDDVRLLRLEIIELKNRQILSRMFHHLKTQAMRQRFDEKMQALQMTLASNKELWDRLGNAAASESAIEHEFAGTAQRMSLAELRIEELRSQLEANADHRQKLQGWRKNKARQVAHLEQKVRSHQRFGAVNVEGMLQELKEKEEFVQMLREARRLEDQTSAEAQSETESRNSSLRAQLKVKRQSKEAAQTRLQNVRSHVERGGLTTEDRLQLWRGRIEEARHRLADAQRQNNRLQELVSFMPKTTQEASEASDEEW